MGGSGGTGITRWHGRLAGRGQKIFGEIKGPDAAFHDIFFFAGKEGFPRASCFDPPSASSPSTLGEENTRPRVEVMGLRAENRELRDECEHFCAAKANMQERLLSRETSPDIKEEDENQGGLVTRGNCAGNLSFALKCEFQVPFDNADANISDFRALLSSELPSSELF